MSPIRLVLRRILLVVLSAVLTAAGLTVLSGSAQAAVPNRWGFAFVDIPGPGVPDPSRQAGSWPAGFNVSVTPGLVGQTYVRFPQIGGPGGVAHVTAVVSGAASCQVENWFSSGLDEIVVVRCYRFPGAPVFVPFTVMYEESTGPLPAGTHAFGYVAYNGGIVSQYNSVMAANTVVPGGIGVWTVTLNGLGSPAPAGNLQVTAVNPGATARCKVGAWVPGVVSQGVQVRCFDAANNPFNTGWNLTYQRERAITGAAIPPKYFAYTFDVNPVNPGPYAPTPVGINYNFPGGINTVQTAGAGMRLVIFPAMGILPDHVQATAYGPGPEYCNLQTRWASTGSQAVVRNVVCYLGGAQVNQQSLVTYTSRF